MRVLVALAAAAALTSAATAQQATPLRAHAGRFWSEELGSEMTIEQRGDSLVLRQRRREAATLRPTAAPDTFEGRNLTLSFERDRNGEVTALYASNGRTRDVRFARLRP